MYQLIMPAMYFHVLYFQVAMSSLDFRAPALVDQVLVQLDDAYPMVAAGLTLVQSAVPQLWNKISAYQDVSQDGTNKTLCSATN